MKKMISILLLSMTLIGCGSRVEIPPAHVGKVLGKTGYHPETLTPSKFRLPACIVYCDRLIVAQVSDTGFKEEMPLFMPKDKLNIAVEIRGTMSIPKDNKTVNALFDRLIPTDSEDGKYNSIITARQVYETYGKPALRGIIRSELVKYEIGQILSEREAIGENIHAAIVKKLSSTNTPLIISRFELADIQPPKVIVQAQQKAKEREIAIQQAEADAKVSIVRANADLDIAKRTRLVEKERALSIAEQNRIAANSVTPQLLAYRRIEMQERIMLAVSDAMKANGNSMIVPMDLGDAATFSKLLGKEIQGLK